MTNNGVKLLKWRNDIQQKHTGEKTRKISVCERFIGALSSPSKTNENPKLIQLQHELRRGYNVKNKTITLRSD